MAQLTADKGRIFKAGIEPVETKIGVLNAVKVYRGSAVGLSSVSGRQLVAGDTFLGFAEEYIDNSGGSAGDKKVVIRQKGIVKVAITGASSSTAMGTAVYASDGDTFTLTATSNSAVGKLVEHVTSTTGYVYFEGAGVRSI